MLPGATAASSARTCASRGSPVSIMARPGRSLPRHVVAVQVILVAEAQPPVGHHGVGPYSPVSRPGLVLFGQRQSPFLLPSARRGGDLDAHPTLLPEAIERAVGVHERPLVQGPLRAGRLFPLLLAGLEIDAHPGVSRVA